MDYVVELLKQRVDEIEKGLNLGCAVPMYIVRDYNETIVSGHVEISLEYEHGFIDNDSGEFISECEYDENEPATKIYVPYTVAYFLTHLGASDYMIIQKHNLSIRSHIYVDYCGYHNLEMKRFQEAINNEFKKK